ncbi:MHYT domain-containing protein [Nocardiopsis ganjiahuensis]|uniref:MHYT domain-containing protein n=1 Tax=Nocardiopsis ganjiahuensis TaxID=239984 RepID=UPI000477EA36|nr:MHYT domain-containing protein [Nocardiopsis ganjiahuensis]
MSDLLPQGWMTPAIAYTISAIGSFLALAFASRARRATGFIRWQWLGLAALSLGGIAVWAMHFVAMLGYTAPGSPLRYDVLLTAISGVIPILVTGTALHLVLRRPTAARLLTSGTLVGIGVVAMHYTGVAAMNTHGEMHHDPVYIALSCVIAVAAATVALWCARDLRGLPSMLLAALVMAAAVTAMHYTGMAGLHVVPPDFTPIGAPDGAKARDLILPLITGLFVFLLICSLFLLLGGDEERERRDYARPSHRAAEHTVQSSDASYRPRHGSPEGPPPNRSRPADDVWTRRR